MLQLEKIKNNIQRLLPNKDKSQHIKLTSTNNNNNKSNLSKSTVEAIPLLTDMEFRWIENYKEIS